MATLLQNIQDVCLELGLPSPNAAATSTDDLTKQLVALMNRVGDTLSTELNAQSLERDYRFQTVYYQYTGDVTEGSATITNLSSVSGLSDDFMVIGEGVMQDCFVTSVGVDSVTLSMPSTATATGVTLTFGQAKYDLPSDFERMVDKTQYNKSNRWAIIGPKDSQEWQWLKSAYITTGPRMRYRIQGNQFVLWPMPASNIEIGYAYISNGWAVSSSGALKSRFTHDDDESVFPDRLLVLGTKLKFFEIKGFDTVKLEQAMYRELSKWKATESGADTLSLAPRYASILLTQNNLPDTGFGNTTT
jgi:hypothetical protein